MFDLISILTYSHGRIEALTLVPTFQAANINKCTSIAFLVDSSKLKDLVYFHLTEIRPSPTWQWNRQFSSLLYYSALASASDAYSLCRRSQNKPFFLSHIYPLSLVFTVYIGTDNDELSSWRTLTLLFGRKDWRRVWSRRKNIRRAPKNCLLALIHAPGSPL